LNARGPRSGDNDTPAALNARTTTGRPAADQETEETPGVENPVTGGEEQPPAGENGENGGENGEGGSTGEEPTPPNQAPHAITIEQVAAFENEPGAAIAALSATDPDAGDAVTFSIFSDASGLFEVVGAQLRLKDGAAFDFETQNQFELVIRATDSAGNTRDQSVTVDVSDVNEAPFDVALSNFGIAENELGGVVGTLSANDPDFGDSVAFTVSDDRFEVVGDQLKLKDGVSLDAEEAAQVIVTVTATDAGGLTTSQDFTIEIADLNEAPTAISLSDFSVAENDFGGVVGTLSASDPDAGDSVAFTVSDDRFEIVGDQLKLKDGVSLNAEEAAQAVVTVTATDAGGLFTSQDFTIVITDLNEAPTAIGLSNFSVAENDFGGVVGTLSASDPDAGDSVAFTVSDDRFEVVGDQLKLKDGVSFDAESTGPINLSVTATDEGGLHITENFSVTVDNVNEGPSLSVVSSAGLKASYYDIGHALSDLDQIDFDAAPDATGVVDSLNYMTGNQAFWDGAPGDYFAAKYEGLLNVTEGGVYVFNMASDDGSMLYIDGVPVLDNDGLHGTQTRSVSVNLDEGAHQIEVRYFENGGSQTLQLAWSGPDTGGVNEVISGEAFHHGATLDSLTLGDDAAGAIVAQLAVSDPDAGDAHVFTVDDDRFEVAEIDGAMVLKLKDGVSIDYETEQSVDVAVTVTDSGGASDTLNFPIAIEDVNQAPVIALVGGEGLQASYYNIGHSLSDLDQIDFDAAPDATGVVGSLNYMTGNQAFWDGAPGDYFAAKYEGQLLVNEGGTYTFSLASDDGSMMFIDGAPVLDNDGLHSTSTRTVTLDLDPGAHQIEVRYFENGGSQTLQLAWSGPDTGDVTEVIGGESFRLPGFEDSDLLGISENAAGDVAARLSITDDEDAPLDIAVSDDRFEVVADETGYVLKLKDGVEVDYESASEISVTVTATDAKGESSVQTFAVPVSNVSEAPADFGLTPAFSSGVLVLNQDGGADDAAIAANMESFPTDALTVEVRFTSDQTNVGDGTPLFSYAASNGSDNEALMWLEGASGNLNIFLVGTKVNTGIPNSSLLDGEEHQVSFTWDQESNDLKVYVDGELSFDSSINIRDLKAGGTLVFGQEQDSEGGKFASNQIFEGEIAEVRIFDYARSEAEIADHAGSPIQHPDTEPGLINNWQMNGAHGGAVEDLAGGDDLQLSNDAHVIGGDVYETPTIVENNPGAVAGVLSATDTDTGGAVTQFAIASDPSGAFEIVGNALKLKDGVSLDHETQNAYEVVVDAIGAGGVATQQTFTINVANVDESPVDFSLVPTLGGRVLSLNQDGGADDSAIAANMDGFPTDALTVEVRFTSDQTNVGDGTPLFSYAASNGSDNEALMWLEGASGNLNIFLAGTKVNTGITNSSLLDGEEHQVSFTWDQATNDLKVYVDGELSFDSSINIRDLKAGGTLAFGQEQDSEGGNFASNQIFEGEIAEVRIFDYARSEAEIAEHAGVEMQNPDTEPGLVNAWVMDSETGGVIADLAGGNDLHLQGDAEVVAGNGSDDPHVAENQPGASVAALMALDPDSGEAITDFVIESDPSGLFEIVGNELKVKAGVSLDYEAQQSHDVVVRAVSTGGEYTSMTVSVQVDDGVDFNMIAGDAGNNTLRGTAGDDHISGGDGNDNIVGRAGADQLYGGAGDDVIRADGDDTVIDGGEGSDRVIVQGNGDFAIDMAASNVERVDGGKGSDAIDASGMSDAVRQYGNAGDDILTGGAGDDIQRGGAGDDVISGGDGNDDIAGNAGADQLYGGAGDDVIRADGDDTVVDGGEGSDRVIVQGDGDFAIDMAASSVERVDGGAGNDAVDASGMTDGVRQYGNAGDDVLTGGSGDDIQRGGDGDDVISGGDGNDDIAGNAGADQLYGGAGDDVIRADGDDTVVDGGEGSDRVIVQGDGDFAIDMAASSVERVDGGKGSDAIDASGMSDGVSQYGNAGDDVLTGGSGDDIQRGGEGDDVISGGAGNDNIAGNAGDDRMTGGAGDDRIVGGDGNDTAVFSGNRADYTIQKLNNNTYRVTDNRDGSPDGVDRVSTVETFEFADQSISAENILNAPPSDIALSPATSVRTVAASVGNAQISTTTGGGSGTASVNFAGASGGEMITFAFASIDNSFEMLVNGQSLSGEVLQLQSNVYNPASQAFLQFEDGSAMNSPWVANGDGSPRLIVQVSEAGVEVFAMRSPNSGDYEAMTIVNGEFTAPEFAADGNNTVTIVNPDDDGPDGLSVSVSAQFDETVQGPVEGESGAIVGTLSASDSDAAAAPSFAIADDPSGAFEVIGDQLKVKDGMSLDASDQTSHDVTIDVMDEHGAIYQETLTVEVQAARPAASQFIFGDDDGNNLAGGAGDDSIYGGAGDDTLHGAGGDDFLSGGDGSDIFLYEMGDGSNDMAGGAGDGWVDVIQLSDSAMSLGEFGTDWTIDLTSGSINSVDEGSVIFSDDASGHINLSDGSVINFTEIEQVTF